MESELSLILQQSGYRFIVSEPNVSNRLVLLIFRRPAETLKSAVLRQRRHSRRTLAD
jgi:hypothetical protein